MWFSKHSYEVNTAFPQIKEIFNIFVICLFSGSSAVCGPPAALATAISRLAQPR
jgi:hypothetical protein